MKTVEEAYNDYQRPITYYTVDFPDFEAGWNAMRENFPTREQLFDGWKGCSNHGCVVTGPKQGMGTNGMCHCVTNASRTQLMLLGQRLGSVLRELESTQKYY